MSVCGVGGGGEGVCDGVCVWGRVCVTVYVCGGGCVCVREGV